MEDNKNSLAQIPFLIVFSFGYIKKNPRKKESKGIMATKYDTMTVAELREAAKQFGLKNTSTSKTYLH